MEKYNNNSQRLKTSNSTVNKKSNLFYEIMLELLCKTTEVIPEKIVRQTIRYLQGCNQNILEKEPLSNIWDVICYQYQKNGNAYLAYDNMLKQHVRLLVLDLEVYEFNAILLRSINPSNDLLYLDTSDLMTDDRSLFFRLDMFEERVVDYIRQLVYIEAKNWTNDKLRKALSNSWSLKASRVIN